MKTNWGNLMKWTTFLRTYSAPFGALDDFGKGCRICHTTCTTLTLQPLQILQKVVDALSQQWSGGRIGRIRGYPGIEDDTTLNGAECATFVVACVVKVTLIPPYTTSRSCNVRCSLYVPTIFFKTEIGTRFCLCKNLQGFACRNQDAEIWVTGYRIFCVKFCTQNLCVYLWNGVYLTISWERDTQLQNAKAVDVVFTTFTTWTMHCKGWMATMIWRSYREDLRLTEDPGWHNPRHMLQNNLSENMQNLKRL